MLAEFSEFGIMDKVHINQKEYLKKYLKSGITKSKKKSKNKFHDISKKVKIIDDDDEEVQREKHTEYDYETEVDILNTNEDAPQVVGVFDERISVDFQDKKRWKTITNDGIFYSNKLKEDFGVDKTHQAFNLLIKDAKDNQIMQKNNDSDKNFNRSRKYIEDRKKSKNNSDQDLSPPRISKREKKLRRISDGNSSPLSKTRRDRKKINSSDSDLSPPRKSKRNSKTSTISSDLDLSPPRKFKKHRKKRYNSDSDSSSIQLSETSTQTSHSRKYNHLDSSDFITSSGYKGEHQKHDNADRDLCIAKKVVIQNFNINNYKSNDENLYLNRKNNNMKSNNTRSKRLTQTLDGKFVGFQNAKDLRQETKQYKNKESMIFDKLDTSDSYQGTIFRDRKTGKRRNLEVENTLREDDVTEQKEINEKYEIWGRGLKQVEDRNNKIQENLHEISKPLARYADDADLDAQLRAVEREGDPMLDYIKKKQKSEKKCQPDLPVYKGSYMPNRFGIIPGCRWDGVDRSNGYEKKWFETQNLKQAIREEAYKWSSADL